MRYSLHTSANRPKHFHYVKVSALDKSGRQILSEKGKCVKFPRSASDLVVCTIIEYDGEILDSTNASQGDAANIPIPYSPTPIPHS